jgi:hypothetical protein
MDSSLRNGEHNEQEAQEEWPLIQLESLVRATGVGEAQPALTRPRPDVHLAVDPCREYVEGEREEGRLPQEVLLKGLCTRLGLTLANVPLRNAKNVDYEGGEKDEESANARWADWKPYPESCATVSVRSSAVA